MSDSEAREQARERGLAEREEVHLRPGEGDEGAYGSSSERALEAFDALPADSEHEVDYSDVAEEAEKGDPIKDVLAEPGPLEAEGDRFTDQTEERVGMVGSVSNYVPPPTLEVELVIHTPDGCRFSFSEGFEYGGDPEDFELVDAGQLISNVASTALFRVGRDRA